MCVPLRTVLHRLLLLFLVSVAAAALHAQAPIERGTAAVPTGVHAWPSPQSLRSGANLRIATLSGGTILCKLDAIEVDRIVCIASRYAPAITVSRYDVLKITAVPRLGPRLGFGFVKVALFVMVAALPCAALGSAVCTVPAFAGLVGALAGVLAISTVNLLSALDDFPRIKLVYSAP